MDPRQSLVNSVGSGLTSAEAAARLSLVGPNVLPSAAPARLWKRLGAQFFHFFAALLWVAGGLAVVGGLPELGIAIFAVIVLNGLFAFAQEYRAEYAASRLAALVPRRVTVVRDGVHVDVDASDLVPGDLVVVTGGDRISADLVVTDGHGLLVDESILTGESVAVSVGPGDILHAGTFLVQGEGFAVVATTGSATELGQVATLTTTVNKPDSPLAKELHRLVRTVAIVAAGAGSSFFVIMVLLGTPLSDGFVFAVGVTVALVPEGLLPTVTLSLAIGAQRMADRNALVRHLNAVETLGSTTFIGTDKTGTLTQNRMNVVEVWTPEGIASIDGVGYEPTATIQCPNAALASVRELAIVARRCSVGHAVLRGDAWVAQGDPMEAAIDALGRRLDASAEPSRRDEPDVARNAFDPARRMMSVITDRRVLVKGAPDAVLARLRHACDDAEEVVAAMAGRGLRVLAIAWRPIESKPYADRDEAESDLVLLGLIAITDPPRSSAGPALKACRDAGIRIAMITGDHPATAIAIADLVGLRLPNSPVLTGSELPDDLDELAALVDHDGVVISRARPEDKLRITRALQSRGHVVAITGDGVNDGPALREADIGVAMGASGTDVAREAADLVLLDDDFATVVAAIRQGRATFANTRQFLTYHLTDNVAELTPLLVWAVSGGRFPLALGVLQILALDLGTDTLSAAALGAEPPGDNVLRDLPAAGRLLNRTVAVRAFGVLGPLEALFGMGAFVVSIVSAGWRPGDAFPAAGELAAASGATFATVVLAQTAFAFACRSSGAPAWRRPISSNRFLVVAATVELLFAASMLVIPAMAGLLDHAVPPLAGWAVALGSMPAMVLVDAAVKARRSDPTGATRLGDQRRGDSKMSASSS